MPKKPKRNLAKELREAFKNRKLDVLRVRKLKDGSPEVLIVDRTTKKTSYI